jgi:hypothetical protein
MQRRLWLDEGYVSDGDTAPIKDKQETYDSVFQSFSSRSSPKPLSVVVSNALVVGQEFILTCLLLTRHRAALWEQHAEAEDDDRALRLGMSLGFFFLALILIALHNKHSSPRLQSRRNKLRQRTADAIFTAALLRFLAAVLKTLTASYSSDTVNALAIASLLFHIMACDYSYANGYGGESADLDSTKRPAFQGGTMSLTAAFFGTTLLASRLESNAGVYVFVLSSVCLFALYPAARHQVAFTSGPWGTFQSRPGLNSIDLLNHSSLTLIFYYFMLTFIHCDSATDDHLAVDCSSIRYVGTD